MEVLFHLVIQREVVRNGDRAQLVVRGWRSITLHTELTLNIVKMIINSNNNNNNNFI